MCEQPGLVLDPSFPEAEQPVIKDTFQTKEHQTRTRTRSCFDALKVAQVRGQRSNTRPS